MRELPLTTKKKQLLRKASRAKIEEYYVSFPQRYRSKKWLHKYNEYRSLCTKRYEKDLRANPPCVNHNDLISYVSASAPTHVIDGWSYLGRAVDATLRGDSYAATHLGYYAELRAAMGLLASEGIGIFNRSHPIIHDSNVSKTLKGNGTHSDIWPILKHWTTLQRAEELLDDLVMPNSIRFSDWLTATRAPIRARAVAQHWLQSWGLDLAVVSDDRDCRNLASYRPSEFRRPEQLDIHQQMMFVEELWQLFEPSTSRRFPTLERLLLRSAYRYGNGVVPSINDLESLGLTHLESRDWFMFLQESDDPSPFLLVEDQVPIEDSTCHLRIMSRATLLLSIASAAARRLLLNAGYSSEDIRFWWGRHGENRALWNSGSVPNDPQDLWADIQQAISDSATWRNSHSGDTASLRSWRRSQTDGLVDFGGFELVGIWALIP